MGRSWVVSRLARPVTARPIALAVAAVMVVIAAMGGAGPRPLDVYGVSNVQTPKQRSGTASGLPHEVGVGATAAKDLRGKRRLRAPKGARPMDSNVDQNTKARGDLQLPLPPVAETDPEPKHALPGDGFDQKTSKEDPSQRDRHSYRYKNADGTYTGRFYDKPVNFKAADGSWQPIDSTLVQAGQGRWKNKADEQSVDLAGKAVVNDLATVDLGAGKRFGFGLAGAAPVKGVADGANMTYPGVRKDTDLALQVVDGGNLKEKIILRSADAVTDWEFPLQTEGVTPRLTDKGAVELVDSQGAVVADIPPGFMSDANIDPHSGDGARSEGITYSLEQRDGGWTLKVSADPGWVKDPARVLPITVDPTLVKRFEGTSDTYVQSGYNNSTYTEPELKAGTYDGGGSKAASYLGFSGIATDLSNAKIFNARMNVFNFWSYSCQSKSKTPVNIYAVNDTWAQSSIASYPGPAYSGTILGSGSFAHGYVAPFATSSACPATGFDQIEFNDKGVALLQDWVNGKKTNHGFTLRTSTTDSYGWKKFGSRDSANKPYLDIDYSPYWAAYDYADRNANNQVVFATYPTPGKPGYLNVKVTNQGHETWTPTNGYRLTYTATTDIVDPKDPRLGGSGDMISTRPGSSTLMPQNVSPGETVTVKVKILALPKGNWRVRFDMADGNKYFSDWSVPRSKVLPFPVSLPSDEQPAAPPVSPDPTPADPQDVPPTISEMFPRNNQQVGTLQPQFSAAAQSTDNYPSSTVSYLFTICAPPWLEWEWCTSSSWQTNPTWTVPSGKLNWARDYYWTVRVADGGHAYADGEWKRLLTSIQQPSITGQLGAPVEQAKQLSPVVGNYTMSDVDASVATVGPPLTISRTYNSLDPRTTGAFGAGWTTRFDMSVVPDDDGTGNVVVTYPNGQALRFGKQADGSFVSPSGDFATFGPRTGGGWRLMDKASTTYLFDDSGRLVSVTDNRGRAQSLTYGTDGRLAKAFGVGGRSLTFTWSGTHVATVSTDPVNGTSLTWTYTYNGDNLTKVCPPTSSTECLTYEYGNGNHYRTSVRDSNPSGYWRLGESSGDTADSSIGENLGTDKAKYVLTSLGTAGALAGTDDKAVTLGGFGNVKLPDRSISKLGGYLSVEAWFKTTSKGTILSYQNSDIPNAATTYTPALYVGNDGKLRGQFWNGAVAPITSAAAVNNGQWHHVALTGQGDKQTLFLDGNAVGTLAGTIDHAGQTHTFVGGGWSSASWPQTVSTADNFPFNGSIDEVAIYDKPLGLPAIRQHYAAGAASQQLTKVISAAGRVQAVNTYESSADRLKTHIDGNGGTWQVGPVGYTGLFDMVSGNVTLTDPRGAPVWYTFDPLRGNRLIATVDEIASPTFYSYDVGGNLAQIKDPLGSVTSMTYDARGNMTSRERCRDSDTCYREYWEYYLNTGDLFDVRNDRKTVYRDGRTSSVEDQRFRWTWEYNTFGELTKETWPATSGLGVRSVDYQYTTGAEIAVGGGTTPAGLLVQQTKPSGGVAVTNAYTSTGDLARNTDAAGKTNKMVYDAVGRVTTTTEISDANPAGVTVTHSYDGLGQLVKDTGIGVRNEVSGVTHTAELRYTYDADGHPLTETRADLTGGDADRVTTYTYNAYGQLASATDPEGGKETYAYDVKGSRTSVVDKLGDTVSYTYTPRAELATQVLKNWTGNPNSPVSARDVTVKSYAYDPVGRLASETDAMGRTKGYSYYGDGLLAKVVAQGARTNDSGTPRIVELDSRSYDGAGHLTTETIGAKTRTDFGYDAVGQLIEVTTDPNGVNRRTGYALDADNNVVKATRTQGENETEEVTSFDYDAVNNVVKQTVENGDQDLVTSVTRDQRGLITKSIEPRGNTDGADPAAYATTMRYDATGQLVEVTQPAVKVERNGGASASVQPVTRYGYDAIGSRTQVVEPEGSTTTMAYDKMGRILSVSLPPYVPPGGTSLNPKVTQKYDPAGRVTEQTNPRGGVTRYAYDALNNLVRVEDPKLSTESVPGKWLSEYDLLGERLATVDPTGARVESTYDDLGRQITSTVIERKGRFIPWSFTSKLYYDDAGNLTSQTNAKSETSVYTVDGAGQVSTVQDPRGNSTKYVYDLAGRVVKVTNPLNESTVAEFDAAGRQRAAKDLKADGTVLRAFGFGYDLAGNRITQISPEGHTSTWRYDAAGRITDQVEGGTVTTTFGYDAAGRQTRLTDGRGNATITTYNTLGLIESVTEPSTVTHPNAVDRTFTTAYDVTGNAIKEIQPGGVQLTRNFDELNRPTVQAGTGAEATTVDKKISYDLTGRIVKVSSPGSDIDLKMNDQGLPYEVSSPTGLTAKFEYDDLGRVIKRTEGAGDESFTYDAAGNLVVSNDPISGQSNVREYDAADRLTKISYGLGARREYTYDNLDRVATDKLYTTNFGPIMASVEYGYDRDDKITSKKTAGTAGAGQNTYGYDDLGRLSKWTNPAGTVTDYEWDASGNRTKAGSATFTYDERNRLTSGDGSTYTYTARGTVSSQTKVGTTTTQKFDAFGRLITDGSSSYAYDGLDRVATRTASATTSKFVYAYTGNDPVAITDSGNTVKTAYARDPSGQVLGTRVNGQNYRAFNDQRGDLTATFDQGGNALTGSAAFSPFGEIVGQAGIQPGLGYQGEYTDSVTGRIDMHARWYNPGTGNFASRDDWTLEPSPSIQANRYTYVNGNPLSLVDPTGHLCADPVTAPICLATAGGGSVAGPPGAAVGLVGSTVAVGAGLAYLYYSNQGEGSSGSYTGQTTYGSTVLYGPYTGTWHGCAISASASCQTMPAGTPGPGRPPVASPPPPPDPSILQRALADAARDHKVNRTKKQSRTSQSSLDQSRNAVERSQGEESVAIPVTAHVPAAVPAPSDTPIGPPVVETPVAAPVYPGDPMLAASPVDDREARTAVAIAEGGGSAPKSKADIDQDNCLDGNGTVNDPNYWAPGAGGRASGADVCLRGPVGQETKPRIDPPGMLGDQVRGHLIAARFGGSNRDPRNFVPLWRPTNDAMSAGVESDVAARLRHGDTVFYVVIPQYKGSSRVPYRIDTYWLSSSGDGRYEHYDNVPAG